MEDQFVSSGWKSGRPPDIHEMNDKGYHSATIATTNGFNRMTTKDSRNYATLCTVSETSLSFEKRPQVSIKVQNVTNHAVTYAFRLPRDQPFSFSVKKATIPALCDVEVIIRPRGECYEPREIEFVLYLKDADVGIEEYIPIRLKRSPGDTKLQKSVISNSLSSPSISLIDRRIITSCSHKKYITDRPSIRTQQEWSWSVVKFYPFAILSIGLYIVNRVNSIGFISEVKYFAGLIFIFGFALGTLTQNYLSPLITSSKSPPLPETLEQRDKTRSGSYS